MKKVLFAVLMLISFGAFSADASVSIAGVHDRVTRFNGSDVRVAVTDDLVTVALDSRNVKNVNKTVASTAVSVKQYGLCVSGGLGETFETTAQTHAIYFGNVGYNYDFGNKLSAGAKLGYQNDFKKNILDRQVTFGVNGAYALSQKYSIGANFERANGDTKTNSIGLVAVAKF